MSRQREVHSARRSDRQPSGPHRGREHGVAVPGSHNRPVENGFRVERWGLIDYRESLARMEALRDRVLTGAASTLVFCQHPRTITLGAAFHPENLLVPSPELERRGFTLEKVGRGGDVTLHHPGQLVAYPVFDLERFGKDLHLWMRNLEESVILALASFGLEGRRFPPNTGVWIGDRKVCAMGVQVRKWVSMHGLALNCDDDLADYGVIVPCGIRDYAVTSLTKEAERTISTEDAEIALLNAFERVFGPRLVVDY
ncbi:lipoyl(octanoyl) transferase LipB [bacterium]|nr:MAG: lipoyl(octanoyl) transferase LipB [bacterium]